jgi:hypothetical protein
MISLLTELEKLHPDNRHVRDNPVKDFVSRGKNPPAASGVARPWFAAARRSGRMEIALMGAV